MTLQTMKLQLFLLVRMELLLSIVILLSIQLDNISIKKKERKKEGMKIGRSEGNGGRKVGRKEGINEGMKEGRMEVVLMPENCVAPRT